MKATKKRHPEPFDFAQGRLPRGISRSEVKWGEKAGCKGLDDTRIPVSRRGSCGGEEIFRTVALQVSVVPHAPETKRRSLGREEELVAVDLHALVLAVDADAAGVEHLPALRFRGALPATHDGAVRAELET